MEAYKQWNMQAARDKQLHILQRTTLSWDVLQTYAPPQKKKKKNQKKERKKKERKKENERKKRKTTRKKFKIRCQVSSFRSPNIHDNITQIWKQRSFIVGM